MNRKQDDILTKGRKQTNDNEEETTRMKLTKQIVFLTAIAFLGFVFAGPAAAFHDGGVANCDGCHTMHNSLNGAPNANGGSVGTGISTWLTKGSDPSSTCLNCHNGSGSYHINSTDGSNFTSGGDFYWLSKTFTWSAHGHAYESAGDDHGHNVIASDFGLTQDVTLSTAPGGTFLSSNLGCNSCHDPHGQKNGGTKNGTGAIEASGSYGADPTAQELGAYRILGDTGYDGGEGAGVNFTNGVPIATAPSLFAGGETDASHADYGMGMSEWCANCHTGFTADSSNPMRHPTSNDAHLGTTYSNNYNSYVKSGDFTGTPATSYLALVSFERGISDPTLLDPASTQGAAADSNVACITCHRAHSSAFPNATRWDNSETFISESHPQATDGGVTGNDILNSYYGRDMVAQFGEFQRSLCNKCHVQD
jgi:hypothetical protein